MNALLINADFAVSRCSIGVRSVWPGSGRVHEHTTRLTRRWALALRPKHHPRSDQSGHVEQPACRTRCPKEPHAQRSWHLQRSLPAQSEDLRTEVGLAESLRRRAARPSCRAAARAVTGSSTSSSSSVAVPFIQLCLGLTYFASVSVPGSQSPPGPSAAVRCDARLRVGK